MMKLSRALADGFLNACEHLRPDSYWWTQPVTWCQICERLQCSHCHGLAVDAHYAVEQCCGELADGSRCEHRFGHERDDLRCRFPHESPRDLRTLELSFETEGVTVTIDFVTIDDFGMFCFACAATRTAFAAAL